MMDPALEDIRELARKEIGAVIKSMAKQCKEGNHHMCRLLFECAGFVRPTAGRPRNEDKKLPGPAALTPEEYEKKVQEAHKKSEEYDDILGKHG